VPFVWSTGWLPPVIPVRRVATHSFYGKGAGKRGCSSGLMARVDGYSWHCNRHTFAVRLVMAGVGLRTVAELLEHRTLQMVMRYAHLTPEHQALAVDRLVCAKSKATPERRPAVLVACEWRGVF
jgi:hypothetical protein